MNMKTYKHDQGMNFKKKNIWIWLRYEPEKTFECDEGANVNMTKVCVWKQIYANPLNLPKSKLIII